MKTIKQNDSNCDAEFDSNRALEEKFDRRIKQFCLCNPKEKIVRDKKYVYTQGLCARWQMYAPTVLRSVCDGRNQDDSGS